MRVRRDTETRSPIVKQTSCHSSRVKVQPADVRDPPAGSDHPVQGRLAQLVRALPDKAEVSGSSPETPTTVAPAWGRSSAGRASPLQGEGQEFESPRLHHLPRSAPPRQSNSTRARGSLRLGRETAARPPDPCAPVEPTDQRIGWSRSPQQRNPGGTPATAPHLNNLIRVQRQN